MNALSYQAHSIPLSRQDATETDPIRPSSATHNANRDCVVAETEGDPDLAATVAAWPNLPGAIRAGILAMVKASRR